MKVWPVFKAYLVAGPSSNSDLIDKAPNTRYQCVYDVIDIGDDQVRLNAHGQIDRELGVVITNTIARIGIRANTEKVLAEE